MPSEMDANIVAETAKTLGLDKLTPAVYQDVLQPAARESGQNLLTVAKAVRIALAPLEGLVWGYEQTKAYVSARVTAKLAKKPPEEIRAPDKTIAGPALINLAFAADAPHLKEMYANLLANAMHVPKSRRVHPSFVQVIQQLTPAEAQLLKAVASKLSGPEPLFSERVAHLPAARQPEDFEGIQRLRSFFASTQPTAISTEWNELCRVCGISEAELAQTFLRNLMRLGLFAENLVKVAENPQWPILTSPELEEGVLTRELRLTEYGHVFLDVCVRDDSATK
jgi:hypothetical protein